MTPEESMIVSSVVTTSPKTKVKPMTVRDRPVMAELESAWPEVPSNRLSSNCTKPVTIGEPTALNVTTPALTVLAAMVSIAAARRRISVDLIRISPMLKRNGLCDWPQERCHWKYLNEIL